MKTRSRVLVFAGTVAAVLLCAGCLLISGTFVVTEDFVFTASSGFYYFPVDVTQKGEWQKHKDNIDAIEVVGFTMTMNNGNSEPVTFNAYVAPWSATQQFTTKQQLDASATISLENLTVPPGVSQMTYAQSLTFMKNLDQLKALMKTGMLAFYGTSTGAPGQFNVDPGQIIVTFNASQ